VVTSSLKSWIIPLIGSLSNINSIISKKGLTKYFRCLFSKAKLHDQNYTVSELIIFLETSFVLSVLVFSVPLYQPVLGFVLRLLRFLGGQRLWARGEEVLHREFARVSTGVGVWIGADLVIADPVAFSSPVLINFFLV
jgi:hypothetical protein